MPMLLATYNHGMKWFLRAISGTRPFAIRARRPGWRAASIQRGTGTFALAPQTVYRRLSTELDEVSGQSPSPSRALRTDLQ
jgi:hypothetical protein